MGFLISNEEKSAMTNSFLKGEEMLHVLSNDDYGILTFSDDDFFYLLFGELTKYSGDDMTPPDYELKATGVIVETAFVRSDEEDMKKTAEKAIELFLNTCNIVANRLDKQKEKEIALEEEYLAELTDLY